LEVSKFWRIPFPFQNFAQKKKTVHTGAAFIFTMAETEGFGLPTRHYLLVTVPKPRRSGLEPEPVDAILRATMGQNKTCYDNFRWNVPSELRVGTMDALYTLLDDLQKNDTFIEAVLRKIGRQRLDLTKKDQRKDVKFMINQQGTSNNIHYSITCPPSFENIAHGQTSMREKRLVSFRVSVCCYSDLEHCPLNKFDHTHRF
jgi:hypothetical protein